MTVPPMSVVVGPAHQIVVTAQSATTITATLTATTPITVTVTAPAMRRVVLLPPVQGVLACTDGADIGACIGHGEPESFITFTDSDVITTDLTTYESPSMSFGPAFAARKLVIGCGSRGSTVSNVPTVTVHVPDVATDPTGTTATLVNQTTSGSGGLNRTCVFEVALATGTVGVVKSVFNATRLRCAWSIAARKGAAVGTANSALSTVNVNPATPAAPLTVLVGGGAFGYGFAADSTTPRTAVWAAGLTENFDAAVEGNITHSGASANYPAGDSITPTCTWSANPSLGNGAVFAVWGP